MTILNRLIASWWFQLTTSLIGGAAWTVNYLHGHLSIWWIVPEIFFTARAYMLLVEWIGVKVLPLPLNSLPLLPNARTAPPRSPLTSG